MHDLAVREGRRKLLEGPADGGDSFQNSWVRQDRNVVFSEIDAGLEHSDQLNQPLFHWLQALGQSAFELLGGDLRLVKRLGVDQIADRFGLGEIDAAMEEGAHGELSGLGETCSGRNAQLDDVPEHDRRSVGGDLDDVVGGIGMGLGEVSDHDFVDANRVSSFQVPVFGVCGTRNRKLDTGKSCSARFDEFPEDCSSWLKTVFEPQ